jgi:hypothetical protein
MMKTILAAAVILSASATVASAGTLDAAEPIVRDYSVHVNIEPGYISSADLAADIRGGGNDAGGSSSASE